MEIVIKKGNCSPHISDVHIISTNLHGVVKFYQGKRETPGVGKGANAGARAKKEYRRALLKEYNYSLFREERKMLAFHSAMAKEAERPIWQVKQC
jgi:hypothetical protein